MTDREQAQAEAATPGPWSCDETSGVVDLHFGWVALPELKGPNTYGPSVQDTLHIAAQDPARTLRRVAEDRKMHAEHTAERCGVAVKGVWVSECIGQHPCKVTRSLAARYDVS